MRIGFTIHAWTSGVSPRPSQHLVQNRAPESEAMELFISSEAIRVEVERNLRG